MTALAGVCLAGLTIRRLFYGVDFADESWYLACSYRFALGDRPFVDEVNPSQAAFLITAPLLRLYVWVTGGIDGAVLYMRALYFALSCCVAVCAWACFRPVIGSALALLASALCVVAVPGGLPVLGYNALASGCFAAGLFLGIATRGSLFEDRGLLAAGVLHGLGAIAIPTYAVGSLVWIVLMIRTRPEGTRVRGFTRYACGAAVPLLLVSPWLLDLDEPFLAAALRHAGNRGNWPQKIERFPRVFWRALPHKEWIAVLSVVAAVGLWRGKKWIAVLCLAALLAALAADHARISSNFYLLFLATSAPLPALLLRGEEKVRDLVVLLWIPAVACGLAAACTSTGGLANAAYALLPGAMLCAVLVTRAVRRFLTAAAPGIPAVLSLGCLLLPSAILVRYQEYPFRDRPVSLLDDVIRTGPFAGLHTTTERRALWESLASDVASFSAPGRRVLFYPLFPAGYLASTMKPAGRTAWSLWPSHVTAAELRALLETSLEPHRGQGVLIFEMRTFPSKAAYPEIKSFAPGWYLPHDARLVLDRPDYAVFLFP